MTGFFLCFFSFALFLELFYSLSFFGYEGIDKMLGCFGKP